jgi:hypothetical protein
LSVHEGSVADGGKSSSLPANIHILTNDKIEITQILSDVQKDEILRIMYDVFEKKLSNLEL